MKRKRRVCDYTEEQIDWIMNNLSGWKNQKEFVDAFNKEFVETKTVGALNNFVFRNKIPLKTHYNSTTFYTEEQNKWLVDNFNAYDDYVSFAKDFNALFGCEKTNWTIRRKCVSLGLVEERPRNKATSKVEKKRNYTKSNGGRFTKGQVGHNGLPVGTVRYNSNGRPYIKVKDCNGKAGAEHTKRGHNFKEPFWKPLQKKIWEDTYGEVPEGYIVCSLNRNPCDTNIANIGIIKKSLTPRMAKNGWWSEAKGITATGIRWLELNELLVKGGAK